MGKSLCHVKAANGMVFIIHDYPHDNKHDTINKLEHIRKELQLDRAIRVYMCPWLTQLFKKKTRHTYKHIRFLIINFLSFMIAYKIPRFICNGLSIWNPIWCFDKKIVGRFLKYELVVVLMMYHTKLEIQNFIWMSSRFIVGHDATKEVGI